MFILTTFSDLIQISPEDLSKPSAEALEDNINAKYANKVIQKIGLCICMWDLLQASEGLIGHETGLVNVNVDFRLVIFRPFKGEILLGKISSSSEDGIKIRLDFFDDIIVPGHLLFRGSEFDQKEQIWTWTTDENPDGYYFDKNESVYFRVESEQWNDLSPPAPSERELTALSEQKSPYIIQTKGQRRSAKGSVLLATDVFGMSWWMRLALFVGEPEHQLINQGFRVLACDITKM
ncbi:MAG: DNA-directed RNA polymerase III subunit rpc25 [Phylliscum demangeonii]|nr:MAG: DNA-directed RNA polymerase III subunit rpc25 [Phylliscum demangeonii]